MPQMPGVTDADRANYTLVPPADAPVEPPSPTMAKALQLYQAGLSPTKVGHEVGVSTSTVNHWLKTYDVERISVDVVKGRLGKAMLGLAAKCAMNLHERLDNGEKMKTGEAAVLMGISSQRGRELVDSIPVKLEEPDWQQIEV